MDLKDVLREINADRGTFVHGRLPFGSSSTATAIWHLDAGGKSRPQHHKQTSSHAHAIVPGTGGLVSALLWRQKEDVMGMMIIRHKVRDHG
jgi:hypothetical protein